MRICTGVLSRGCAICVFWFVGVGAFRCTLPHSCFGGAFPGTDELVDRLKEEAPACWRRSIESSEKGLAISTMHEGKRELLCGQGQSVLSSGILRGDGKRIIFGANPLYSFRIDEVPGTGEYELVWLTVVGEPKGMGNQTQLESVIGRVRPMLQENVRIGHGRPFPSLVEILDNPDFRLTYGKHATYQGGECLEYGWTYPFTDGKDVKPVFPAEGRFWVDPDKGWSVLGWESQLFQGKPNQYISRGTLSDYRQVNGAWVAGKATWFYWGDNPQDIIKEGERVAVDISATVDPDVFYLSHYGLPEPVERPGHWPRWPWLVGGVCVLALAGGMVVRRLRANPVRS